jgi:hypothetical protein
MSLTPDDLLKIDYFLLSCKENDVVAREVSKYIDCLFKYGSLSVIKNILSILYDISDLHDDLDKVSSDVIAILIIKGGHEIDRVNENLLYTLFWVLRFMVKERELGRGDADTILKNLIPRLSETCTSGIACLHKHYFDLFHKQLNLVSIIKKLHKVSSRNMPRKQSKRLERMRSEIRGWVAKDEGGSLIDDVPSPFNHTLILKNILLDQVKIYPSSNFPLEIPLTTEKGLFRIIYKNGDDLSNDLFIINLLEYISQILSLNIITFKVIPLSRKEGIIKVIEGKTLSEIEKKYKNHLRNI